MKQKFIIQNAIDKKYWQGLYSSKNWTTDILEARLFDRQEMEEFMEDNFDEFEDMFLVVTEVWY